MSLSIHTKSCSQRESENPKVSWVTKKTRLMKVKQSEVVVISVTVTSSNKVRFGPLLSNMFYSVHFVIEFLSIKE